MLYLQGLKYAMVLMRGMLVLLLATVIIKMGILHPLGACGTTEKMLVTCHASSEQVPPMTPTTAEGQLQSDPWSQHRDLDQSGARNGRTLGHNTAP